MSIGVHDHLLNIRSVLFFPCVTWWSIKGWWLVVPRCVVSIVPVISAAIVVIPIVDIATITVIPIILIRYSAISTIKQVVTAQPPSSAEVCVPSGCTSKVVSSVLIRHV